MLSAAGGALARLSCSLPQAAAALGTGMRYMSTSTDLKAVLAEKIPTEQVGKGFSGDVLHPRNRRPAPLLNAHVRRVVRRRG